MIFGTPINEAYNKHAFSHHNTRDVTLLLFLINMVCSFNLPGMYITDSFPTYSHDQVFTFSLNVLSSSTNASIKSRLLVLSFAIISQLRMHPAKDKYG